MSTRIVDLDLDRPFPADLWLAGSDRLLVIAWRKEIPLAFFELPPGQAGFTRDDLTAAVARLRAEEQAFPPSLPPDSPPVSVVVCTCRRPADLACCLDHLRQQKHPPGEIVVVDNAPAEPAVRDLLRAYPEARYAAEPNPGIRYARNRGLAEARGEVVAFIDDDCRPVPGWLAAIIAQFAARPHLGCCTGPVLPGALETRAQELIERRGGFNRGFARRVFTRTSGEREWKSWPLQTWMFGSGANMAFRRRVFEAVGPFDQILRTGEDLEFFYRVLRAGYELAYEPAAVVRHRHPSSYTTLRRRLFLWGWGYVGYLLKVACDDPLYRQKALGEIASWFPYQVRDRLWPRLRCRCADFPLDLIVAELAGGLAVIPNYLWCRWQSAAGGG